MNHTNHADAERECLQVWTMMAMGTTATVSVVLATIGLWRLIRRQ